MKLKPEQLLVARLQELSPGAAIRFSNIVLLNEVESTNDEAWKQLALRGLVADGTVVIARSQSGGRGRLGRSWSSPVGNLHMSLVRRIVEPLEKSSIVSLISGIAMVEAICAITGVEAALKWPNDLLIGEAKLAGILLEGRDGYQVVGIGVNVNVTSQELAPEVRPIATTLQEQLGRTTDLQDLAASFLVRFAELEADFIESPSLPLDRYMRYFPSVGERVRVERNGEELVAPIAGVASDGALLLQGDDGESIRITTGEVTHVRRD
jgi:BirA family transcriptional regulator, biotin operon repressor / biotin---[acetyl-CoA-carboxylase] ligase